MATDLSAELLAELQQQTSKAVWVAQCAWPSGVEHYSDLGVSSLADGTYPRNVLEWGELRQGGDRVEGGLEDATFSFKLADVEARAIRSALGRHSRLTGSRLTFMLAGSTSVPRASWYTAFQGGLADMREDDPGVWSLEFEGVNLFSKPLKLRTVQRVDWPDAREDAIGQLIPRVSGKHQSFGLGGEGALPTLYVDTVGFRYLVGEGQPGVPWVYVDGVLVTSGFAIERPTVNGRVYTLVNFSADQGDATITVDTNQGSSTTDPEDLLREAVQNLVSPNISQGVIQFAQQVPLRHRYDEASMNLDDASMTGAQLVQGFLDTYQLRANYRPDGTVRIFRELEWEGDATDVYGGTWIRGPQACGLRGNNVDAGQIVGGYDVRWDGGSLVVADAGAGLGPDDRRPLSMPFIKNIHEEEIDRIATANLTSWFEAWQKDDRADGEAFGSVTDMSAAAALISSTLVTVQRFESPTGLPAGELNGTSSLFTLPNNNTLLSAAGGTVFLVLKVRAANTNDADTAVTNEAVFDTLNNVVALYIRSNGTLVARNEDSGGGDVIAKAFSMGAYQIVMWRHLSSVLTLGVGDFTPNGLVSIASGNTVGLGANALILGRNAGATQFADINIAACATWNIGLSDEDVQRVVQVWRGRWLDGFARDSARSLASLRLLRQRNTRNRSRLVVGLEYLDLPIRTQINVSHPDVPGGDGIETWQRRAYATTGRVVRPQDDKVELLIADQVPSQTAFWWNARPLVGPSDGYDGVAMTPARFVQCGGRDQCFVDNPASDQEVIKVAAGRVRYSGAFNVPLNGTPGATPIVIRGGLVSEDLHANTVLRSSGIAGTTGLTLTGTGVNGSAITADTGDLLLPAATSPNSIRFLAGSPHTTDLVAEWPGFAVSSGTNTYQYISIDAKCDSGVLLQGRLVRTSDGFSLDPSTGTWGAAATWWNIEGYSGAASSRRRFRHFVPAFAKANDTYTLSVRMPSGVSSGAIARVFHVQHQATATGSGILNEGYGTRDPNDTSFAFLDQGVARIYNGTDATDQLWPVTRGTVLLNFFPFWKGDLITTQEKVLFLLPYDGTTGNHFFKALFTPGVSVGPALLEFRVKGGGGTEVVSTVDASSVAFGREYRLAFRWTSSQLEQGLTANTITALLRKLPAYGINGELVDPGGDVVRGTDAVYTTPTAAASEIIFGDQDGMNCAAGILSDILVLPRALSDDEMAHWMA